MFFIEIIFKLVVQLVLVFLYIILNRTVCQIERK